ncbi:NAD(P)/FAD-dependent oxidoreductase [Prochlorococcus sp. MIT 0916]|uniref:D-amino acid dehydrogenase small subunit n=1 Tax=Prochlorococcus marinus str. P0903-H212 TaxID=1622208 RepID=A0A0D5A4F2_PROMR|nr:D-amino acid dehydrogenase small subunit [Prochlorococcus marinus str. P0903-H212]
MNSQKADKKRTEISVIGSGIAGLTTAFQLGKQGYKVNLIDPKVNSEINNLNPKNGTQASLGVLMGNVYKRSKGRAFLLRNKSMKLWKEWLAEINYFDSNFIFTKPLIKLANSEKEYQSMIELSNNKKKYGIELLDKSSLDFWNSIFETKLIGGIISHEDGRLNPTKLVKSLIEILDQIKINKIDKNVIRIRKNSDLYDKRWNIDLENNQSINQDYIVICSALNTQKLLKPLGYEILLEPILGQVLELELPKKICNWKEWPAILNYQSINFIHHNPNQILIGATIERGTNASLLEKKEMLNLKNTAPKWMINAKIKHEWSGIRARPTNEPSPLLKQLEPGLLINTGHYRNGILLAPACAEWIGLKIEDK